MEKKEMIKKELEHLLEEFKQLDLDDFKASYKFINHAFTTLDELRADSWLIYTYEKNKDEVKN